MNSDELVDDLVEASEASEWIASTLREIADAAKAILESGLNERAIILLLQDKTGVKRSDIQAVLRALPRLGDYTTQPSSEEA